MNQRTYGFLALLAVVGVSIVFGMILGGQLNSPEMVLAAPKTAPLRLAPASRTPEMVTNFADIVERAMPAVVSVTAADVENEDDDDDSRRRSDPFRFFFGDPDDNDRRPPRQDPSIGEGSGFLVSPDGYILTNNHVVEAADVIRIGTNDGREFTAELVGADPSIDLALLKIETDGADVPSLPLGSSRTLRVGEWVIAIGNPLEYEHTVTVGVVSAKERRVQIGSTDAGVVSFIQTDAAINFGNSGGPLLDAGGNVIGINTAIRRANYAEGIGFALPVDQARNAMMQLLEKGYVTRGYIGITMNTRGIDEEAREIYGLPDTRGVIIQEVADNGPADKAGLQREDIIRKVNGEVVRDNLDLIGKISSHQPGDRVELEVFRRGKSITLRATLVDRQESLQARSSGSNPFRNDSERNAPVKSSGFGITVENLTANVRERLQLEAAVGGVLVTDVDFNSEASDEGIVRNMVIVEINDTPIRDVEDWDDVLGSLEPGSAAKITVLIGSRGDYFFLRVPE